VRQVMATPQHHQSLTVEAMRSPSTGRVEDLSSALFSACRWRLQPATTMSVEGLQMDSAFSHRSVQLSEVLDFFVPVPAGVIVDCTLGGAGHAQALLEQRDDLAICGIDRDPVAREAAAERLAPFGDRAVIVASTFDRLGDIVASGLAGFAAWPSLPGVDRPPVVGVLMDLGVSSPQLDVAERGFSYRADAPLDMRMDQTTGQTAAELLEAISLNDLTDLLRANGEDRLARRIAQAIINARPLSTTGQLADVVSSAVPAAVRRRGHPAKRTFQALRIAVNGELDQLRPALEAALDVLVPGGRLVVQSYHSGEDRIVKQVLATAVSGGCTCPPQLPCVCGAAPIVRRLHGGSVPASASERHDNGRAESVRLRAVEKISQGV